MAFGPSSRKKRRGACVPAGDADHSPAGEVVLDFHLRLAPSRLRIRDPAIEREPEDASMTRRLAYISLLVPTLLIGTGVGSCARNPVTGKSELSLVSESQEIQMGQQASKEVAQSMGFYKDAAVQAYVADLGKRMAAQSERPNLPWEFHVVEDASV